MKTTDKKCAICDNKCKQERNKTCSKECGHIFTGLKQRGQERNKEGYKNNGGLRIGGGRAKVFEYNSPIAGLIKINNQEIRVAKILDTLKLKWKRNITGFLYQTVDGLTRKYYPDFYLEDFDVYVEFKGWVTSKMVHKMENAIETNKLKLLIIYGEDKRYSKLGLNIKMIEEDSKKLLNELR